MHFDVMQSGQTNPTVIMTDRQTGDEVTSSRNGHRVTAASGVKCLERSNRGCFFSLAPERHKGTIHCFLNVDATYSTTHYVSVRMCERQNRTQDPFLLQFLFYRHQTIHSHPLNPPSLRKDTPDPTAFKHTHMVKSRRKNLLLKIKLNLKSFWILKNVKQIKPRNN